MILQVKWKEGMKNWRYDQYLALFRKQSRYGHSYNRRLIGTCMRSIEWYHFNDLERPITQISRTRQYSTKKPRFADEISERCEEIEHRSGSVLQQCRNSGGNVPLSRLLT